MARGLRETRSAAARARRAPSAPRSPTLDGWDLIELAAAGAYSQVFRARPSGSSTPPAHALKRLRPELADDARAISFLRREARVGRAVSSEHLVPVLAAHTADAPYYLIMPWLAGETLADRLGRQAFSTCELADALWIARQVAQGLDALHAAGWTHADIKPANIMLSPQGHVTLIDMGFARRPGDEDHGRDSLIAGTPWYLAPEVMLSVMRPDIRSDIFSLGAVLYEMLTGRVPFAAGDAAALVTAQRQGHPAPLRQIAPQVPPEVARLVHAMLAKEPTRRPQTPQEVVQRLSACEIAHLVDGLPDFDDE